MVSFDSPKLSAEGTPLMKPVNTLERNHSGSSENNDDVPATQINITLKHKDEELQQAAIAAQHQKRHERQESQQQSRDLQNKHYRPLLRSRQEPRNGQVSEDLVEVMPDTDHVKDKEGQQIGSEYNTPQDYHSDSGAKKQYIKHVENMSSEGFSRIPSGILVIDKLGDERMRISTEENQKTISTENLTQERPPQNKVFYPQVVYAQEPSTQYSQGDLRATSSMQNNYPGPQLDIPRQLSVSRIINQNAQFDHKVLLQKSFHMGGKSNRFDSNYNGSIESGSSHQGTYLYKPHGPVSGLSSSMRQLQSFKQHRYAKQQVKQQVKPPSGLSKQMSDTISTFRDSTIYEKPPRSGIVRTHSAFPSAVRKMPAGVRRNISIQRKRSAAVYQPNGLCSLSKHGSQQNLQDSILVQPPESPGGMHPKPVSRPLIKRLQSSKIRSVQTRGTAKTHSSIAAQMVRDHQQQQQVQIQQEQALPPRPPSIPLRKSLLGMPPQKPRVEKPQEIIHHGHECPLGCDHDEIITEVLTSHHNQRMSLPQSDQVLDKKLHHIIMKQENQISPPQVETAEQHAMRFSDELKDALKEARNNPKQNSKSISQVNSQSLFQASREDESPKEQKRQRSMIVGATPLEQFKLEYGAHSTEKKLEPKFEQSKAPKVPTHVDIVMTREAQQTIKPGKVPQVQYLRETVQTEEQDKSQELTSFNRTRIDLKENTDLRKALAKKSAELASQIADDEKKIWVVANEVFTAKALTSTAAGSLKYDKAEQSKLLLDQLKGSNKQNLTEVYTKMNSDIIKQGGFEQDLVKWLSINEQELNDSMAEVRQALQEVSNANKGGEEKPDLKQDGRRDIFVPAGYMTLDSINEGTEDKSIENAATNRIDQQSEEARLRTSKYNPEGASVADRTQDSLMEYKNLDSKFERSPQIKSQFNVKFRHVGHSAMNTDIAGEKNSKIDGIRNKSQTVSQQVAQLMKKEGSDSAHNHDLAENHLAGGSFGGRMSINSSFEKQNVKKAQTKDRITNFQNINVRDLQKDKNLARHIGGSSALAYSYSFDQIPQASARPQSSSANSARQIFPGVTLLKGSLGEYQGHKNGLNPKWVNSRKPPTMNFQIRQKGSRIQPITKNEMVNMSRSSNQVVQEQHSFGVEGANFQRSPIRTDLPSTCNMILTDLTANQEQTTNQTLSVQQVIRQNLRNHRGSVQTQTTPNNN